MNIIFISRAGRRLQLNAADVRVIFPVSLLLLIFAVAVFAAGFFSAHKLLQTAPIAQVSVWKQRLATEKHAVDSAKAQAEANINALSSRLGLIQAHIIRLDALGQQLVKMADLDPKEFSFDSVPAEGGPEIDLPRQDVSPGNLLDELSRVSDTIRTHQQQLNALENILMHRNLHQEMQPSGRPVKGGWISSYFGRRVDPITGRMGFHPGIDFAGKLGSPVHAVAAGVVTWAGPWFGYGNLVEIDDGNGYATRYGHNEKILVKVGQTVAKGQVISLMGSTGHSTGPHVHLEVLYHGREINPLKFVRGGN
jgi:murein DD-endopeptidase MepM/ murein hydrolase activator NlpD